MDQAIRNKLRSVVTQCRRLLEESIAQQLQGKYDIYATGKKDEVRAEKDVPLEHLSDHEREGRREILAHFEHIEALGYTPRESLEQLIREIAFTHLNRLCAYKMMEVRDVYVSGQKFREAVSKGLKSQGFLFYLADHPDEEKRYNAGQQEEAYRHYLNWLGDTLSQEIGILFSPTDPANRVYPSQRVLDDVLDLLNSEELKGIWSEDETIGWVYQYFTPKELRDEARKASQAPRNSYELAFRNQFFTPRYVVEFLTDNTLGRIWYEMRAGNTRLKDGCRYMVRRPGEVFFSEKGGEPGSPVRAMKDVLIGGTEETFPPFRVGETQRLVELAHTVDGYERHPIEDQVEGEWWPWTKLREIREAGDLSRFPAQELLDVLFCQARADRQGGGYGDWDEIFYDIANEVRRRTIEGRKEDASQEQLFRSLTAVVHRAKKDPREIKILDPACGSGHFLLYCFALLLVIYEEAYDDPELGLGLHGEYPTKDDLRRAVPGLILRHNLHGIDIDLRCTQIAALALWLRCQRAYKEMGFRKDRPRITKSNIVCAEPMPGEGHMLKEFVDQIEPRLLGQLVEVVFDKMKLAGEAGSLLKIEEEIRDAVAEARRQWRIGPVATQMRLFGDPKPVVRQQKFDLSGITEAQFFEQAEAKVVDALRSYSEQAQNGQRLKRRLFADDAVRGFAFVDLCHKRFDVVLMNPPFGSSSVIGKSLIDGLYPRTKSDLYAAFVERGLYSLDRGGLLGAITSRTGFFLSTFQKWRQEILLHEATPTVFGDLGYGVLDTAMVETAAYCIKAGRGEVPTTFLRLLQAEDKESALCAAIAAINFEGFALEAFAVSPTSLSKIPTSPFIYWVSEHIRSRFKSLPPFQNEKRQVRLGDHPSDDFRYLRLWWEVKLDLSNREWVTYYKGGSNAPYYGESSLVVDWDSGRQTYRGFYGRPGRSSVRPSNYQYFFLPGLTVPYLPHKRGHFSHVPPGGVFGHASPVVQLPQSDHWSTLGLLNSDAYIGMLHLLMPRGVNSGQTLKYETGYLSAVPLPAIEGVDKEILGSASEQGFNLVRSLFSTDESSRLFTAAAATRFLKNSLSESVAAWRSDINEVVHAVAVSHTRVNECCFRLYGISDVDRKMLQHRLAAFWLTEPADSSSVEEDESGTLLVSDQDVVAGLISYTTGCSFGRWEVRFASGELSAPTFPDPFEPVPTAPLGAYCGGAITHEPQGLGCPLHIDGDGILVDDSDHPDDIIRRVRDVLEVIWKDRADAIEKEACEILGVADLRDHFRKSGAGGFWDDHIKRYSKSRRKAPIYWLLQSSKKNFALWIYYQRLDKDILFKALLNYVEPKVRKEEARLDELRSQKTALGPTAKGAKKFDKDIDRQEAFLSELRDFEDKLSKAANLHLDPDLNDGVVLNIAPLRELVPWKEAKSYWDDLMDGKYEWSSIAKQLREKGLVK